MYSARWHCFSILSCQSILCSFYMLVSRFVLQLISLLRHIRLIYQLYILCSTIYTIYYTHISLFYSPFIPHFHCTSTAVSSITLFWTERVNRSLLETQFACPWTLERNRAIVFFLSWSFHNFFHNKSILFEKKLSLGFPSSNKITDFTLLSSIQIFFLSLSFFVLILFVSLYCLGMHKISKKAYFLN